MGRLIMRSKQTRRCWSKTCKLCDGVGGRLRRRWLILQTAEQFLRIANSIWDALSSGNISKRAVTTSVFFSRKRSCDSGQPICEPKRSTPAVGMRLMSTWNADRSVFLGQNSSHFSKFTSKPDCFPSVDKSSNAFSKSALQPMRFPSSKNQMCNASEHEALIFAISVFASCICLGESF